ncbi:GNAT family N-acetyltransferase [Halovenus halobia]|uniref:GNAT family N-acetyltransferase n=1 Tax=Halovenus halobia TaxID=3396622 RepID=UPI003F56F13F
MSMRVSIDQWVHFLLDFPSRTYQYLRWRASNLRDRVWMRSQKVAYYHRLTGTEGVQDDSISIEPATDSDLTDIPGEHDIEEYRQLIAGDHVLLLVREDTTVIGYLWVSFSSVPVQELGATIDFDGDGYIWHVHLLDQYRGRGIGKQMIRRALELGSERSGCERVFCITGWSNLPMRRVLEKTGFEGPEHISYSKLGLRRRWSIHDKEPGPFADVLDSSIDRSISR